MAIVTEAFGIEIGSIVGRVHRAEAAEVRGETSRADAATARRDTSWLLANQRIDGRLRRTGEVDQLRVRRRGRMRRRGRNCIGLVTRHGPLWFAGYFALERSIDEDVFGDRGGIRGRRARWIGF